MNVFDIINSWIDGHLPLVVSVGVPVLTAIAAGMVSFLTTRANNKAHERQRKLTHQLKLADFRQAWINDMREDVALYTARTWSADLNEGLEAKKERIVTNARILMRMNPNDPEYEAMRISLLNPVAMPQTERLALFEVGQRILKQEWDRLKKDLEAVDGK
jgi:hypothetical protein